MGSTRVIPTNKNVLPTLLVFLSGLTGLVYQVLWMRQLGLLFGNTAYAAATVLAVFFGGLAVGSWFWGRRIVHARNPLRTYAGIEFGIAAGALFFFAVIPLFRLIYPALYQAIGDHPVQMLVKAILAMLLVFPASFCMGGTIPAMGQHLITEKIRFGTTAAWLYGINTVGAALGTLLAAFYLVPQFGFAATCMGAIAVTSSVGLLALWLSRQHNQQARETATEVARLIPAPCPASAEHADGTTARKRNIRWSIYITAFSSGFFLLALEVLWTRMFAQIHENSVYSFSVVLVVVLICLAIGALLASLLARVPIQPFRFLCVLLMASGVALLMSPYIFLHVTNGYFMLPTARSFASYFFHLIGIAFLTIGPVCILAGMVFPFLMKAEEPQALSAGYSIGKLTAINTTGAILGSLACGFWLLPRIGMWGALHTFALLYLAISFLLPTGSGVTGLIPKVANGLILVLAVTLFHPSDYPVLAKNPNRAEEQVLETWDTGECSLAVVKSYRGSIGIKVNANYILGETGAAKEQVYQGWLPLYIKPDTESVFFLGMGTGMTAGAILDKERFPQIREVVACEVVPEVVHAAQKYLTGRIDGIDYTSGLFQDPRVEIIIDDGRHYLMATEERFDMIQADLFLPYRHGAGSLYSVEHFETAREKLTPNGIFVQWLPMFQLTDFEFGVIARTMLHTFEHVTMWENNFAPGREIVALVGSTQAFSLPSSSTADYASRKQELLIGISWDSLPQLSLPLDRDSVTLHYAGNLSKAREEFAAYPLNTDDLPIIEYHAPISIRKQHPDGGPPTLVGPAFSDLVSTLFAHCPPEDDPVLRNRSAANRRLPRAGQALHEAWMGFILRDERRTQQAWNTFVAAWLNLP